MTTISYSSSDKKDDTPARSDSVKFSKSKSVFPSNEDQKKGQEMAKILWGDLIKQNHEQRDLVRQTDPNVYDARENDTPESSEPSESSGPAPGIP